MPLRAVVSVWPGNQALEAAKAAVSRFKDCGVAWRRPEDYYAEMVKSDEHMLRVKEQLNFETEKIEAAEERWEPWFIA